MSEINLSASIRSNLLSLQSTQSLLNSTQERLASGKKVNSALDDANAFFASQSLDNRASDLGRLLDSMSQGIQVIQAADNGITALTDLIEQAQSIAQEARDQASGNAQITIGDLTSAEAADLTGATAIAAGDDFTLQVGTDGPVIEFNITAGMSLADLAAQINAQDGLSAQVVDSPTADQFAIQISTTNGADLITADGTNTPLGGVLAPNPGGIIGTNPASTGVPEDRVQLEADFNTIRTQIDQLITDTGYRGTNLLNGGSLSVDFNEDGSSSITVSGVTLDSAGLNLGAASFDTIANIDTSIDALDTALGTLRSTARSFGTSLNVIQSRESFTNNVINNLQEGSDKLTLADLNEEGANLLALQTAQQLGITSLSLAAQSQQSVLQLF